MSAMTGQTAGPNWLTFFEGMHGRVSWGFLKIQNFFVSVSKIPRATPNISSSVYICFYF